MQLSNLVTALAVAATARALPSAGAITPRTGEPVTYAECINNNQKPLCCSGLIGSLLCIINLLGDSCSADQFCCTVEGDHGAALINVDIDLLNCVDIL
ncbi:hypothetical protein MMYC01_207149 [Madurella mycetomatis]|uniref:Hydrophobin n=1 Tax=Madurella mycetomatis TaxID=100816 RepID=A0A175W1V9_9PEZI|nr:hypothetical protein MMYC01_207149 [Madurella mycetomatis]